EAAGRYHGMMRELQLSPALASVWEIVARANRYLVEKEPWQVAKDETRGEELASILYAAAETLRILTVLIQPVMPDAARRLWEQLGMQGRVEDQRLPDASRWGILLPGTKTMKG